MGIGLSGTDLSGISRADVRRSLCPFPGYSPGTLWVLPRGTLWVLSGHSRVLRVLTLTATITFASVAARSWSASNDGSAAALARPASAGGTSSRSCRDVHAHAHAQAHMHTRTHAHAHAHAYAHTHAHAHNHAYRCTYPPHTYTHTHTLTHTCTASGRCGVGAFGVPNLCCIACSRHHHGAPLVLAARDKHRCLYLHTCRVDGREREDTSPARTRTASKTTQLGAGWGPLRKQTRRSPENRVRD